MRASIAIAFALAAAGALPAAHAADPCASAAAPRVAFVFEGAASRLPAHRDAAQALQRASAGMSTSARGNCVRTFEDLSNGVDPDANARFLLGSLGLQRYALVVLLTPKHGSTLAKVAREFPATKFLQMGGRPSGPNHIAFRPASKPRGQTWTVFYDRAATGR